MIPQARPFGRQRERVIDWDWDCIDCKSIWSNWLSVEFNRTPSFLFYMHKMNAWSANVVTVVVGVVVRSVVWNILVITFASKCSLFSFWLPSLYHRTQLLPHTMHHIFARMPSFTLYSFSTPASASVFVCVIDLLRSFAHLSFSLCSLIIKFKWLRVQNVWYSNITFQSLQAVAFITIAVMGMKCIGKSINGLSIHTVFYWVFHFLFYI